MTRTSKHSHQAVGERLRVARQAAGLSTRIVASHLSAQGHAISHATISNYERGETTPPGAILRPLAEIYNRPVEWIRSGGLVLKGVRFRALKSVGVRERNAFKHESQMWFDAYFYIEDLMNRKLENRHPHFKIGRDTSGRVLAEKIRRLYNLNDYPISSTVRVLEHFGIYVIQLSTDAYIDAFAGWIGDSQVVVLNATMPNDRIRLNVLHELAHHLYQDNIRGASLPHDDIESRAFEFASHLLLPESQLIAAFKLRSMVQLVQYKERFGISLAAMIYRARKSKLIPKTLYERLWRDFARLGYRKHEPGHVGADRPLRMEALIDAAISSNKISWSQVGELAGTTASIVKQRVLQTIGSTVGGRGGTGSTSILDFQSYRNKSNVE